MSFIIQLLCNAILVTYSGCNDMAWQIHLMRKAFHCSALQIGFYSIYHTLFSAFRFFQHYTFMSNCVTCEMYISPLFLYTSETWDGSICLYILIFTSFLSPYVCYRWWVMSYGMADDVSSHLKMYFLDVVPELFLVICIFLYLPKNIFCTS